MTHYFSVACIAKDETPYIEEWVNYHRAVGADHVYIYDNGSEIPIKETLAKYIEAGLVDVVDFPGSAMQSPAYADCLNRFGNQTKWLGVIDCDEFIVPRDKDTVSEILKEYEEFGGVVVNWFFIGSDDKMEKPEGLVIENYIKGSSKQWCINSHIKSIIQPEKTRSIGHDPHCFYYKESYFAVDEARIPVQGSVSFRCVQCISERFSQYHEGSKLNMNRLQINHYYTKSREEFIIRYDRTAAHLIDKKQGGRDMNAFDNVTLRCQFENKDILKFVEKTKSLYIK